VSDADRLIALLEGKLRPLETALAEAWWETSTRASPEAAARRERIELERRELLGDPDAFGAIEAARRQADQFDPLVVRQLDILHDAFVPHQIDAELRRRIVELEVDVETTFNTFRGQIDGQRVDDNAIAEVLRTSDDSRDRRAAWEASKQVG
jgi:peptidyl-dipeptidase A